MAARLRLCLFSGESQTTIMDTRMLVLVIIASCCVYHTPAATAFTPSDQLDSSPSGSEPQPLGLEDPVPVPQAKDSNDLSGATSGSSWGISAEEVGLVNVLPSSMLPEDKLEGSGQQEDKNHLVEDGSAGDDLRVSLMSPKSSQDERNSLGLKEVSGSGGIMPTIGFTAGHQPIRSTFSNVDGIISTTEDDPVILKEQQSTTKGRMYDESIIQEMTDGDSGQTPHEFPDETVENVTMTSPHPLHTSSQPVSHLPRSFKETETRAMDAENEYTIPEALPLQGNVEVSKDGSEQSTQTFKLEMSITQAEYGSTLRPEPKGATSSSEIDVLQNITVNDMTTHTSHLSFSHTIRTEDQRTTTSDGVSPIDNTMTSVTPSPNPLTVSNDTISPTQSGDPKKHMTTDDAISKPTPSSFPNTPATSQLKVTSLLSGVSRTRRQMSFTDSQFDPQTTAAFVSTVPGDSDWTINEASTEPSQTSSSTTELITSDSPTTTEIATTMPPVTPAAELGTSCQSDARCSSLEHSTCYKDVCSCRKDYHANKANDACVREPYQLIVQGMNESCVHVRWRGSGESYNVTVGSQQPEKGTRQERSTVSANHTQVCGMTPGSAVNVSVALSSGGKPAFASTVMRPLSPSNVNLDVNTTCLTVSWEPADGIVEFYILKLTKFFNGAFKWEVSNHTTNQTEWTQCRLGPGTMFLVELASFTGGAISEWIKIAVDSTLPSAPTHGQVERLGDLRTECLTLLWIAGEGMLNAFNITYWWDSRHIVQPILIPDSVENATVCSLPPGTLIHFSIVALSVSRPSEPLLLEGCTEPESVQTLKVGDLDASWIELQWTHSGKGHVDRFVIMGNHSDEVTNHSSSKRRAVIDGLSPGTVYTFFIAAMSCNLTSDKEELTARTNYSAFASVNVTSEGTWLHVYWQSDQDVNPPVHLKVVDGNRNVYEEDVVYTASHRVNTNRSGECFTVHLKVLGSTQEQTVHQATQPAPPQQVQNLSAYRLTNERDAINITWLPPALTNGVISQYRVDVKGLRGLLNTNLNVSGCTVCQLTCPDSPESTKEMLIHSVRGLSLYENYQVTITAYTTAGPGPPSQHLVVGQLLDKVSDFTVTKINSTCLKAAWKNPPNADSTDHINFLIEYGKVDASGDDSIEESSVQNTGQVALCGLQFWTTYWVNVTAVNSEGRGRTDGQEQRTAEHMPGAVTGLSARPQGDIYLPRTVDVTWRSPSNPHGVIQSYFIVVHDTNTSKVMISSLRPARWTKIESYKETLRLVGDHYYHIQVFGATGAGNGTIEQRSLMMPAGALPTSNDTIMVDRNSLHIRSVRINIPTSALCDFSYGLPAHAGYIVLRHDSNHYETGQGQVRGSRPAVTAPWGEGHTAFYVRLDVLTECPRAVGGYISVKVGDASCRSVDGTKTNDCGGPLRASTEYHVLGVFCTSVACTYSRPTAAFTTLSEPEEGSAGLAAGMVVLFLAIILGSGIAYWMYRKQILKTAQVEIVPTEQVCAMEIVVQARPVRLEDFADHVEQLHRDSNLGFSEEYRTIKELTPKYPTKAAELMPCKAKNRYLNILPWDKSRVKLIPTDDEEGSDYINANYLPGENHQREFIAAQGPLPATVDDFWRMVWENKVCVIVMLTQCVEKGKTKCEKYWPNEGEQTIYGDLTVRVRSQSVLPDYIIRVIDIQLGNRCRMIKHFHFMRWPDHGCPEKTSMLLNFVSSVRAHMPHSGSGPTLVHCSAGVGRTGTFIALDQLLQQIRQRTEVDIFSLVLTMRENRMQMVQTENQYVYIHDCLLDALTEDQESDDDSSSNDENEHIYGNC